MDPQAAVLHSQSHKVDGGEGYGGWATLPVDVLYNIMKRLRIVHIISLSGVCKGFRNALKHYPSEKFTRANNWFPSLMITKDINDSKRDFISVVKNYEKYIIDLEDFSGANLLCSKKGWFLFSKLTSLFLLHPLTRQKLSLPAVDADDSTMPICLLGHAAISVDVDTAMPTHVILANPHPDCSITLAITCPGDQSWRKFTTCGAESIANFGINNIHVVGKHVYCVDKFLGIVGFDMESFQWDRPKWQSDYSTDDETFENVMELDGEIIRVSSLLSCRSGYKRPMEFRVYKLDRDAKEWHCLELDEVKTMSFFLTVKKIFSIAKAIPSTKVHLLHDVLKNVSDVTLHDLDDPESEPERPFSRTRHAEHWGVMVADPNCSWVDMDFYEFYFR